MAGRGLTVTRRLLRCTLRTAAAEVITSTACTSFGLCEAICGCSLRDLQARVAKRLGRTFCTTADNQYRVSDYTVVRDLPGGVEERRCSQRLRVLSMKSNQQGQMLASSIHIHFMLDGAERRSKASGAEHLLARRGIRPCASAGRSGGRGR